MIRNSVCPYCSKLMVKAENQPLSRSVEHLIPNVVLTSNRNKGDGDFYACRACNSSKSEMDYVLGALAKSQCNDEKLALGTIWKALDDPKRNSRFIDMILAGAEQADGRVTMPLPVSGHEVATYADYLAKGQYFKRYKKPISPSQYVVTFEVVGKLVFSDLLNSYKARHGTTPFEDLKSNPYTEVIADSECLIWSKNNRNMFIFHSGFALITKLMNNTKRNVARRRACLLELDGGHT